MRRSDLSAAICAMIPVSRGYRRRFYSFVHCGLLYRRAGLGLATFRAWSAEACSIRWRSVGSGAGTKSKARTITLAARMGSNMQWHRVQVPIARISQNDRILDQFIAVFMRNGAPADMGMFSGEVT